MKIKVFKPHPHYGIGHHDVDNARGNYLVKMGMAEKVEKTETPPAKVSEIAIEKPVSKPSRSKKKK